MKKRVNIYVDGFNFYYGLKSKHWQKYYWIDMIKLFDQFIKDYQELCNVYYFTARPIDQGKKDRQNLFLQANQINPKFKVILGKYFRKQVRQGAIVINTFEEKQTDVNIAVEMIRNVVFDKCDISILVSADSDLLPPINMIREISHDHKIFVFFPPQRHSADLKNHSDGVIKLARYETRFRRSIMDDEVELPSGFILRKPASWF